MIVPLLPREKLQFAYELAFFPPRLLQVWNGVKKGLASDRKVLAELVDMALSLHQALPESGYASQRALMRLAIYQANARSFGMVTALVNLRKALGARSRFKVTTVPGSLVRDIGLPPLCHDTSSKPPRAAFPAPRDGSDHESSNRSVND